MKLPDGVTSCRYEVKQTLLVQGDKGAPSLIHVDVRLLTRYARCQSCITPNRR